MKPLPVNVRVLQAALERDILAGRVVLTETQEAEARRRIAAKLNRAQPLRPPRKSVKALKRERKAELAKLRGAPGGWKKFYRSPE